MISYLRMRSKDKQKILNCCDRVYDDKGNGIINMNINDDSSFLSPYSLGNGCIISGDVAEFLDNSAKMYKPKDALSLSIYSNCVDSQEQAMYTQAIKQYYARQYADGVKNIRAHNFTALYMLIVGVIGFVMLMLAQQFEWSNLITTLLDIFVWVFVWEAVDIFFIARHLDRYTAIRYYNLATCDINYYPMQK